MQGARYESGLDNSPMYDGEFFKVVKAEGSLTVGQMAMYDVGFASMVVRESDALATLATRLGRADDATRLAARAAAQRKLIADNLWDDRSGIFTNRFWNGSFYRRVSPTSFYAMLARAATDEQAVAMVSNWLLSPDHSASRRRATWRELRQPLVGSAVDRGVGPGVPAARLLARLRVGPMAQLTYWSLQQYDHVPIVRKGRKALSKQMTASRRVAAEPPHLRKFQPAPQRDRVLGHEVLSLGALNGMITMVEEGWYSEEALEEATPLPARRRRTTHRC